jgi:hypothetical protein
VRARCLPLLFATAASLALMSAPSQAALELRDGRLVDRGKAVFLRGAMYWQPHAFHHCFWEDMNQGMVARDFAAMHAQGFNMAAVQVNWGSFMPAVDVEKRRYEWSQEAQRKLVHLLDSARRNDLYVDLWFGTSRVPAGINGMFNPAFTDLGGVKHAAYYGWLVGDWPAIADYDAYAWQAFLRFHERVARICRGFDNVIFDPLDWQHLNLNYWNYNDPLNLRSWRDFLRRENPDLDCWNKRWGESNRSWDEVLFPVDDWARDSICKLGGTPYYGLPSLPYEKEKWQDFNRWHNPLFIRIVEGITAALRRGDPGALILQRVDPWRFGYWREMTWGVGSVDCYAQGWYPSSQDELDDAQAHLRAEIDAIRTRATRPKPLLLWEVGIDVFHVYPTAPEAERDRRRAQYVRAVERFSRAERLLGWSWWVWRDHNMNQDSLHWGLVAQDGRVKSPQVTPATLIRGE